MFQSCVLFLKSCPIQQSCQSPLSPLIRLSSAYHFGQFSVQKVQSIGGIKKGDPRLFIGVLFGSNHPYPLNYHSTFLTFLTIFLYVYTPTQQIYCRGNRLEEIHTFLRPSYLAPTTLTLPSTITAPSLPLLLFFFLSTQQITRTQ